MNTNSFETPNGLDFVTDWNANSVAKNVDRKDIRDVHTKFVSECDSRIAFFCETFRELNLMNFILTGGCELRDGSGCYKCTCVDFAGREEKASPAYIQANRRLPPCHRPGWIPDR